MTNDLRERVAQLVYERGMLYLRTEVPAWTPGGNSLAQDEARAVARLILDHTQADKEAAVAAEREEIVQLIRNNYPLGLVEDITCDILADEIRARGDTDAPVKIGGSEWADKPDDWTDRIKDDYGTDGFYSRYAQAMDLVSNRHSKSALVALVCYLLRPTATKSPSVSVQEEIDALERVRQEAKAEALRLGRSYFK